MRPILASLAALAATGACAYEDYGPYGPDRGGSGPHAYDGRDWAGASEPYRGELRGPGVAILDRWLLETREGREIVTLGFSDAVDGEVSEDVAHRANIWFRRHADSNRDMRITDPEIRAALANSAIFQRHWRARRR